MGRHRAPVAVAQLVGVAMIRGDRQEPHRGRRDRRVDREDRVDDAAEARVDDLEGGDRRVPHAGVADHVRVREVGDDEVVAADPIASTRASVTPAALIAGSRS